MWRGLLLLLGTRYILRGRRKRGSSSSSSGVAHPDLQTTCYHVKEDSQSLDGVDTLAIGLTLWEVSLLSTADTPHPAHGWVSKWCFKVLLSTIQIPVPLSSARYTFILGSQGCVWGGCRGVGGQFLDRQRGGVEGKAPALAFQWN